MIYPATRQDLDRIFEIEKEAFHGQEQFSREQLRYYVTRAKGTKTFCIAEPDLQCLRDIPVLCGYFIIKPFIHAMRIFSIGIAFDFMQRGIGTRALKYIEQLASEQGKKKVKLEVRMDSKAINFYHKNGYKHVGNLYKYYSDGMDAAIMEKDLTQCLQCPKARIE